MRIIRSLIVAGFFGLAFCSILVAQEKVTPADDFACTEALPKVTGETVLSQVQKSYAAVNNLEAQFQQRSELAALEQSETSSGAMWFMKPGLMKWHYTEPEEQDFLIRDDTLWLFQPKQNQVIVDQFKKVLISDLPVAFMMGIGNLKEDFSLQSTCRTSGGTLFELSPKPKSKSSKDNDNSGELKGFRLLISTDTNLPKGASVIDIGGNTTTIELSHLKVNKGEISDKVFKAEFPVSADIVDRRAVMGLQ